MGRCGVRSVSFQRWRNIAYGVLGVVLCIQWLSVAGLGEAGAQTDGPIPTSQDRPAVVLGNARADSALAGVSIRNGSDGGGLNIGFDMGVGLVTLKEENATANSTALDLTAMYQLFGPSTACPGRPAKLATRPPTAISNSSAPSDATVVPAEIHYPGLSGAPDGALVGTQVATATGTPAATVPRSRPTRTTDSFESTTAPAWSPPVVQVASGRRGRWYRPGPSTSWAAR